MNQNDVLVVGAGPVGMWTALLLAEAGIQPRIIDQDEGTAGRSYACALHPQSLELLDRAGLAAAAIDQGHRIDTLVFYEGNERRAEIKLARVSARFPFLVVLPQNVLESLLQEALNRRAGVRVQWNHRLSELELENDNAMATIDKLGGTATGYVVPHWEVGVKSQEQVRAAFVVGSDGHDSVVRHRLGIGFERVGDPQSFVVAEFDSDWPVANEVRIVLDGSTTNVLWPLPGGRFRWNFQLVHGEDPGDFPAKQRSPAPPEQPEFDERAHEYLVKLAGRRAPWFKGAVREIHWFAEVQFQRQLAQSFGKECCWLAGDAAHQTSPVGMQSMNVGLREARKLVAGARSVLRPDGPNENLEAYNRDCRKVWQRLLGADRIVQDPSGGNSWAWANISRILPCLPASDVELDLILEQLGLRFA
jgi:2-polyprenyl-6-methoxyphenol hydroxylase-like FAD-dependent oxidoreductase